KLFVYNSRSFSVLKNSCGLISLCGYRSRKSFLQATKLHPVNSNNNMDLICITAVLKVKLNTKSECAHDRIYKAGAVCAGSIYFIAQPFRIECFGQFGPFKQVLPGEENPRHRDLRPGGN